jgi:hypothetical protein
MAAVFAEIALAQQSELRADSAQLQDREGV